MDFLPEIRLTAELKACTRTKLVKLTTKSPKKTVRGWRLSAVKNGGHGKSSW